MEEELISEGSKHAHCLLLEMIAMLSLLHVHTFYVAVVNTKIQNVFLG